MATTDSAHEGPIFPNLAKDFVASGPNQLWVSDITYVALPSRFVYVAIILDAWSRLVVVGEPRMTVSESTAPSSILAVGGVGSMPFWR